MPLPSLAIPGFDGLSHTVNTPNSGRQAAADSAAAVLSTEDKAALDLVSTKLDSVISNTDQLEGYTDTVEALTGALTETAPASDTASSGLNGRLQRIAQRITSLIAQIPTALGQGTKAQSLTVTVASDDDLQGKVGGLTETAPATDTASSGLNGRLQRIAQRITSLIAQLPTSLGIKTAANSLSITHASDDALFALQGAVTETAPATDTASSGLNGRLQRIAQRITSLIALVPTSLGVKTAANSFAVVHASDDGVVVGLGAPADTAATTDTGTFSLIALFKRAMGYWSTMATAAADTTTPSPVKIDQTTDGTTNRVNAVPGSTAHALIPAPSTYRNLSAAATTNGANIKSSAGTVKGIQGYNAKASAVYLKLYNKASAPAVGTDTPVKTIYLPATAAFAFDFGTGVAFATGISIAMTGAGADADTTALVAGDILALNVDYH